MLPHNWAEVIFKQTPAWHRSAARGELLKFLSSVKASDEDLTKSHPPGETKILATGLVQRIVVLSGQKQEPHKKLPIYFPSRN